VEVRYYENPLTDVCQYGGPGGKEADQGSLKPTSPR
jgi:hypothetical protein